MKAEMEHWKTKYTVLREKAKLMNEAGMRLKQEGEGNKLLFKKQLEKKKTRITQLQQRVQELEEAVRALHLSGDRRNGMNHSEAPPEPLPEGRNGRPSSVRGQRQSVEKLEESSGRASSANFRPSTASATTWSFAPGPANPPIEPPAEPPISPSASGRASVMRGRGPPADEEISIRALINRSDRKDFAVLAKDIDMGRRAYQAALSKGVNTWKAGIEPEPTRPPTSGGVRRPTTATRPISK